ncbi:MAG TPA: gephyrin-like molybdotransferase Glp [Methanomicrobiales archaeon]|nr:gephyrin-like molybdotransferase Glp [Methanomicrobiales archaeon]
MSLFLRVVTLEEAVRVVRKIAPHPPEEEVPLRESLHRVLARKVRAAEDIPGFARTTVDGYAVRASETVGAGESLPSILRMAGEVPMGSEPGRPLGRGEGIYLPTGAMLPDGADAAVMIEYTERIGAEILVKRPVAPGENVILAGEDFPKGAAILPKGTHLSPRDVGILAAAGYERIEVNRRPVIGIISTGNELVPVDAAPGPGEVRDANGPMCAAFVEESGCSPRSYGIIRDDRISLGGAVDRAVEECDAVLISGGSSKDVRDLAAAIIAEKGEVLVHGIGIAPGKPTIIGRAGGRPVIGLPGHPASAYVILHTLAGPLLGLMSGAPRPERKIRAILAENIPSQKGRVEFVRVRLEGGRVIPCFGKSGLLNTFAGSAGLIQVPAESEGLESGESVEVILW